MADGGWGMGTEAQINGSQGLDGESEDLWPGRPRSFTHNFGMYRRVNGCCGRDRNAWRFGVRWCPGHRAGRRVRLPCLA